MGTIEIEDTDFDYEMDPTENTEPPGSAELPEQPVLLDIQHRGENFFFVLELIREKTFHIHVQDHKRRPLNNACIEITDLDHPGSVDILYTNKFGNAVYVVPILSRYRFKVSKLHFKTVTFELGMLTSQPAIKGIRTLFQDFKFIIEPVENRTPVLKCELETQTVVKKIVTVGVNFRFEIQLEENEEPVS